MALTACGGDGGNSEGELTEVSVGAMPIADTGPLWLGVEKGFYEQEGLDLEVIETTGGAVQVPGVLAGEYDFAFANIVTGMVAHDQGLPVEYIINGSSVTGDPDEDVAAVLVPADSPIQSIEDLEGTTMTSNNLNNVGDTAIRAAMDLNGYEGASAEFIELAFGEAMSVAEQGQVDAVLLVEPYKTIALQQHDARIIMHPYTETHENFDIGGLLATHELIEGDPELVEAFQRATARAMEYAQENPEELREVILANTTIEEDIIDDITLPTFRPEFDREAVQVIADAAHQHGVVSDPIDLDELLPEEYTR
ncbi:ABC transporter substrate-binding protein [Nesterenkonia flava]|uniref:ABC transporter substrate-binding protein n=1 Tax=Nesterenkonia flava TaxID=469799 RepID=A0ABU1FQZ8_9MICC|nr:ABC transporter substrate-binding protein [Nesterenkonia flava]MDR5710606.1 ABC transporter substrate-binding protein [Nesterenkonia flava]